MRRNTVSAGPFQLVDYLRQGDEVVIGTDASPTRLGGWLMINGVITAFFSDAISTKDEEVCATTSGRHEDQQTWEFLAILVALRLWIGNSHLKASQEEDRQPSIEDSPILAGRRVQLILCGDNVGSLSLSFKLRAKSLNMAVIAREVALVLAHMAFPPRTEHTPGVAHVLADRLSRVASDDDPIFISHPALARALRCHPAERGEDWYKALRPHD